MFAIIAAVACYVRYSFHGRVPVVLHLWWSFNGRFVGRSGVQGTLDAFNNGLGGGAQIALAYEVLGAFALALARSGLPDLLAYKLVKSLKNDADIGTQKKVNFSFFLQLVRLRWHRKNVIPVHIAFIPVLIPPLLIVFNHLRLDRRAVRVLTFGLVATYIFLPMGFGAIF